MTLRTPLSFSDDSPDTSALGFVSTVRNYMRDLPALNALLDGQETSDSLIQLCGELAIDDFNTSPPLIGNYDLTNFPSKSLLIIGTIIWILRSAGILQSRNQLDYASGGVTVAVSNKTPLYQSWIAAMMQEYENKKVNLKKSINAEAAYGFIPSEYATVNSLYGSEYYGSSIASVRSGLFY